MVGSRFDKEISPRPIGPPRPTGNADGTRDTMEPPSSSRRRADAHRASALDGSSPSLVIKEVHTPGGSGTPGPADGTRDIKEPPSSSRRRADAHRASALDGSSPAPTLQKAQIPGRVSVLFGAADGTRTRTVSLPGDFKFSILVGNVGILREFFGMLY